MRSRAVTAGFCGAVAVLLLATIGIQVARDARTRPMVESTRYLYVPSGRVMQRLVLSFDALAADVYWIRALQYYGGTRLAADRTKDYGLLYSLLDLATTLDPYFNIAYRFGAIFLCEGYPNGPGRPDQAVALLQKGLTARPDRWQYLQDIGFVYYWWFHDYRTAASWFERASKVKGSPWWLKTLAATTLAQGGARQASRRLWTQLQESGDDEWLRNEARRRLLQLDALEELDRLIGVIERFIARTGTVPGSWDALVRAGDLTRAPVDPSGLPYVFDAGRGSISISEKSPLFPLPAEPPPLGQPGGKSNED